MDVMLGSPRTRGSRDWVLPSVVAVVAVVAIVAGTLLVVGRPSDRGGTPVAPRGLSAAGGEGAVEVAFDAPDASSAPVDGYEVSLNGSDWVPLEVGGSGERLSGTVSGLAPGTTYEARVRALGDQRASAASSETAQATTDGDALEVETDAEIDGGRLTVTVSGLDPVEGPEGWRVRAEPIADDTDQGPLQAVCPGFFRRCTVQGVSDEATYSVSLVPFTTRLSSSLTATEIDGDPIGVGTFGVAPGPPAPTDLRAVGLDDALRLTWTGPEGERSGFQVSVGDDGEWQDLDVSAGDGDAFSAEVAGLTNGRQSEVSVRATDDAGPGAAATVAGTPAGPPSRVREPEVDVRGTTVTLRWTAPRADGGVPVRAYVVSASDGNKGCTTKRTTCTIRGVDLRPAFRYSISAFNTVDGLPDTGLGPAVQTRVVGPGR